MRAPQVLRRPGALATDEAAVLEELIILGNSAAHGAEVAANAPEWATEMAPRILAALDEHIEELGS